ncbi:MAG: zinc-ribbon domain-containing protein, partial [bacterium]|nr:zinc-ribbon domain-containing protein [bacterium]
EKENSIAKYCPQIKNFWDYEKNGKITPEQISHGSEKKIFLKCPNGHEWSTKANYFCKYTWCPYCSGRKKII